MNEKKMTGKGNQLTGYLSIDKPWLRYYSDGAINAPLPECTIYEYMHENNKDYSGDIAINYMGRKITYKKLFEEIDKTTAAFLKLGVKKKEIVTVALPSIPEALYCVYALNKIGAVANMIHPLAGKDETINYINEVDSRFVVIFDRAYEAIANSISEITAKKIIVASPKDSLPIVLKTAYSLKFKSPYLDDNFFCTWNRFVREGKGIEVKPVEKNCNELALISHTGGTTGEPKGVMCSDRNVNSLINQIAYNFKHERQWTCMTVLPPFVNYSLVESMLAMLYIGFEVVLMPEYIPEEIETYISKYHPNVILSIPAYWEALLKINKVDMSCFKYVVYGGEAMNIELEEKINDLMQKCGSRVKLLKGIGSTEMMAASTTTYDDCNMIGSVGIPLAKISCKIVEPDTTKELFYNEDGEICFSGDTLMMGYYNNQEATDKVIKIHKDGYRWFHTGDIGHIDENGVIYVTGRIKRIIMTKGNDGQVTKMFPDRIEKAICNNQFVELCCVIGVPDEKRINYPKAFVVLKQGENEFDATKQSIIDTCKSILPDYMIPEEIEFRRDLPRTSRGKVDYRALEQETDDKA